VSRRGSPPRRGIAPVRARQWSTSGPARWSGCRCRRSRRPR
jgi:hypothetical protein